MEVPNREYENQEEVKASSPRCLDAASMIDHGVTPPTLGKDFRYQEWTAPPGEEKIHSFM